MKEGKQNARKSRVGNNSLEHMIDGEKEVNV